MCLAARLQCMSIFLPIREWRCEDIDAWILTGLVWCSRSVLLTLHSMVAHSNQRYSLIILQLINILNPYGSKLYFHFNLKAKLSAEFTSTGSDFDTTIKFNALIACGTKIALDAKLIYLAPFLSFLLRPWIKRKPIDCTYF